MIRLQRTGEVTGQGRFVASAVMHQRSTALIGFGMALIALGLGSWLTGLDLPLHHALRFAGDASARHRIAIASAFGGLRVMGPVVLAAMLVLLARRRRADAVWLVLTVAGGRLFVELLKTIVARPRPPVIDRLEIVRSWSFPSSHSAGTMLTGLALAILWGGRGGIVVAVVLAMAIGWTRVALAVHWPGDVLAGWGIGTAWLGIALRLRPSRPVKIARQAA